MIGQIPSASFAMYNHFINCIFDIYTKNGNQIDNGTDIPVLRSNYPQVYYHR